MKKLDDFTYNVRKLGFAQDDKTCAAYPSNVITVDFDYGMMLATQSGSIIKDTEYNACTKSYWNGVIDAISKGYNYKDDYISVRPTINGAFLDKNDRFDPERHKLVVHINPSKAITDVLENIVPVYQKAQINLPEIDEVKDWFTNTENSLLSPGNFCEIIGDELKIFDEPESQGVWFVSKATGDETECARIQKNEPKTLVVQIPALEKGEYQILIRNRSRNNKALRTELFDIVLTVE